ncbi:periplasmic mannitol-binding protein [Afipia carboxidovorans OM5]|uniref:TRAP transport system, substrate-binding protein n=1 Tax=Afipia carboxidovorans (strain ATCC 49405 / DSM 1227 / KCTC 32145 / OM5) TaxID=504832 RepID=B6JE16_AFIC5|nr:TRAP transporter substrate-binding protein [Afipia carboxidovorans]ACI93649.1 periplasmic mannitol-binding protein [Afipia carboxidovorans OM5]AEI02664.1 TRAP transport system, substrate-binding protein [Afipia carboxidovorans OM4]AEI06240.1 TRAP transport system, substrate-binding protein [Afipia carboxidovorans OM5]BEV47033.1 TRAP transporter substrate-binding protein [Afipia carboxidovorans]
MKRRDFLKVTAAGAATAAVASPAIAQSSPEIKWRLTSSFPKSLDTIYGGAELMAKQVAEMTDNKFQIQVFAAGEVVPGLQALDATSNGTVEMCHTATYYYVGKDPTFAIYAAVPFGLNARMQNSWWYQGGGDKLANEFFKKHGVIGHPCGNTGTQMGGWFRKEIKSVADLSGLKMRIGGIAGQVLAKLGVVPQQLAGGDIYPSLEKGTIDAAEWIGPYDDEKLGFNKVAPYYYYPGFWEGGLVVHSLTNLEKWNSLPKNYQAILANANANANTLMAARYDLQNPGALKRLVAGGTQLRPYSNEILEAALKATNELWAEISAKNADFKKSIEAMQAYRGDEYLWWQVAEYTFDSFQIRSRTRG